MARTTVDAQISRIRKQREILEKKEKELLARSQNKSLDRIVQIARANGISAAQISDALKVGGKGKAKLGRSLAKKASAPRGKVAPKYRNPADPQQTWTGRGKMPLWVKALHSEGKLETARIAAPSA
jgi:DNA-binding protein H-NS